MSHATKEAPKGRKLINPDTGRKDQKLGKMSSKTFKLFHDVEIREASMREVADHLTQRLTALGDANVEAQRKAWYTLAKEMNLDVENNVYRYDRKTGQVYFIETMEEKRLRESNPISRLLAGR